MPQKSKNGVAFFERGSWYHRTRYYDEDYIIKYGKKGGFKTQEEAEKNYYKHRADFETVQQNLWRKKDTSIEFRQYLQTWLNQQTQFQSNTRNVYRCVLGQALLYMPEIKLCAVNENYINSIIRIISAQTKSYGLKLYELFSMALADAYSESLIDYNPMVDCMRPKREIVELNILTKEQKQRFMQYVKYNNSVRKSEVAPKTYTKQEVSVKTPSSRRKLEMPACVLQAVMDERVRYEKRRSRRKKEFQDLDYIYSSSYGRPRTSNYLWKRLHNFIDDNGLPYTTWRGLRYTYTTTILKAGYDLSAVSRTLGHTRKEFTADVYVDRRELIKGKIYFENRLNESAEEADAIKVLNGPLTDEMKLLLEYVNMD